MKAFWVDRETNAARLVETDGKLQDLYRLCHCSCIDITVVSVCGIPLNVVVDDEGLLVDRPIVTVYDTDGNPMLAGSVVFFGMDEETDDLADLTDEQVSALRSRERTAITNDLDIRCVILADKRYW